MELIQEDGENMKYKIAICDDSVWNGVRQIIIYRGLLEKFCRSESICK